MTTDPFNSQTPEDAMSAPVCPQLDPVQEERCKFDAEFLDLQNPRSSSGRVMYVFVRRNLRAFHLSETYRESFVLNEAYIRGIKLISEGTVIRTVPAWLRSTSYNIIRELSRELQKSVPLEEHTLTVEQPWVPLEELEDDLATVRMALSLLDPQDARLLNLKIGEGRSWKEIRDILRLEGWEDLTEEVLRKRKERALIKLRKKYHTLKPPEFPK